MLTNLCGVIVSLDCQSLGGSSLARLLHGLLFLLVGHVELLIGHLGGGRDAEDANNIVLDGAHDFGVAAILVPNRNGVLVASD